jgi:hypothetical protein
LTQGEASILFELLDKISSPRYPHAPAAYPERANVNLSDPAGF